MLVAVALAGSEPPAFPPQFQLVSALPDGTTVNISWDQTANRGLYYSKINIPLISLVNEAWAFVNGHDSSLASGVFQLATKLTQGSDTQLDCCTSLVPPFQLPPYWTAVYRLATTACSGQTYADCWNGTTGEEIFEAWCFASSGSGLTPQCILGNDDGTDTPVTFSGVAPPSSVFNLPSGFSCGTECQQVPPAAAVALPNLRQKLEAGSLRKK